MKKITLMILLMIMCITVTAQSSADSGAKINERFYQAKVRELVYRLHITDEQKAKFEPIYRSYCQDMTTLWAERKKPIRNQSNGATTAAIEKRKIEMQQRAQGIRMKYIDKFATVLNDQQLERFFEVESIIQKKLKERQQRSNR